MDSNVERNCSFGDVLLYLLYSSRSKMKGCRKHYDISNLYKECVESITQSPDEIAPLFEAIEIPDAATYTAFIMPRLHEIGTIRTTKRGSIKMTDAGFDAYARSLTSGEDGFAHRRFREFHKKRTHRMTGAE